VVILRMRTLHVPVSHHHPQANSSSKTIPLKNVHGQLSSVIGSPSSASTGIDTADELNDKTARAVWIFTQGNKDDKEFARTLAKRVLKLPSRRKSFVVGLLEGVDAQARKRIRVTAER
jgi:hypothetical protein